jgi:hypothetical protein
MFGSDIPEVAAGVVFVFVLISTICSTVREAIEAWLKTRAAYLALAIRQLLLQDPAGKQLAKDLFEHPLVDGLFSGDYQPPKKAYSRPSLWQRGGNLPSYIPSRNFALALMDIVARTGATAAAPASTLSLTRLSAGVAKIANPEVKQALLLAIDTAGGDVDRVQANIEAWYDSTMERVSGWYRRSTQWVLFWIALVIAVGLNVNTLTIADSLYRHPSERDAIASTIQGTLANGSSALQAAQSTRKDTSAQTDDASRAYVMARQQLDQMHLPLGWANGWGYPETRPWTSRFMSWREIRPWDDVFEPLIGLLITAFAATLGAPFWFDVLGKITVVRSTVKPEPQSDDSAADAPQISARVATAPQVPDPDADANDDTCGIGASTPTPDELLPVARGGVAST